MGDEITPSRADIERVGRFLDGISRGVITELSQLLGQQVAYWRFKNAVTIALKAHDFLETKGLKTQQLPAELRVVVPLIESASYEDDPSLQKMWASLLAASVSPEFDSSMHPKYSEVLKQLFPIEVRLLHDIYEHKQDWLSRSWIYALLESKTREQIIGLPAKELQPFFVNLDRLNLVHVQYGTGEEGYFLSVVTVLPFLLDFMERCTYIGQ
jgi:hypothetical protein